MTDLQTPVLTVAGQDVSLRDLLVYLRERRLLRSLLLGAAHDRLVQAAAREHGITVSDAELQRAADEFRSRHNLAGAADTRGWLESEGLSADDFEAGLERDLLRDKWRDHLTNRRLTDHFNAHRDAYTQLRLHNILVAREDLAHELQTQLQEGAEFAVLARAHSRHASCATGGDLGVVLRAQLPTNTAAALATARAGDLVGPVATPAGFEFIKLEAVLPAELNPTTIAFIRRQLYDGWLQDNLKDTGSLNLPPWNR